MPFNINQILGSWRRKETKGKEKSRESLAHRKAADTEKTIPQVRDAEKKEETSISKESVVKKGESEFASNLLISPHISEKATIAGEGNYIFKVNNNSNKNNVKKAVEERYGVEVTKINVINTPDKKRRRGAVYGIKSGYKKAIIRLKEGQTISEF
ncbi:50S ribosomal protein L23 [Candidatus Giovannonibacteria bacterium]|nr:50S ribosomal protein L23 [Candidatus Giovannonibacteria bacterium]